MEHLAELQNMFPSLDGDVIAIVLNQSKESVEVAVEKLLELSSQTENSAKSPPVEIPPQSQSVSASPQPPPTAAQNGPLGWLTPAPPTLQSYPPLPTMYNHAPAGGHFSHGVQPTYRPFQPLSRPPAPVNHGGYNSRPPDPGGYNSWVHHGGQYSVPVQYTPGRSITTPANGPLPTKGVLMNGDPAIPSRSTSAPHMHRQWRPPNPNIRSDSSGHVTTMAAKPHPPLYGQRNIPRVQNRHLEPRGQLDHSRAQGSKGHEKQFNEPKPSPVDKKLIIIRGLPGSGKSTLAKSLRGQFGVICSTDDFFMVDGKYVFDPSLLQENHDKNRSKAEKAMTGGKSPVIIDNTNSNAWEMKPYVTMAIGYGYDVKIVEPDTPWRFKVAELAKRNKHGVTRAHIERMLEKYEHRMSVERILTSERPGEATPPARATSSEQNKEEKYSRHPNKETEKAKTSSGEKVQRTNGTASKHQETKQKPVSPKPAKKNNQQQRHSNDSGLKTGNHDNQSDSTLSKSGTKAKKTSKKSTHTSSTEIKQPSVDTSMNHMLDTGAKVPLANVHSVAEIEADLLGTEWDSSEEREVLAEEHANESQSENVQVPAKRERKGIKIVDPMTMKEIPVHARKESSESYFKSVRAPRKGVDPDTMKEAPLSNEGTNTGSEPHTQEPTESFPDILVHNTGLKVEQQAAKVRGMELIEKAWEMASTSTDTSELTAMFSELQTLVSSSSVGSSADMTTTTSAESVAMSTITWDDNPVVLETKIGETFQQPNTLGGKKERKSLTMLSAAFDNCKGWEEKYLEEAARDEAKKSLDAPLDLDFLEGLLSKEDANMMVSFSDTQNMGVVRKSRLVSGLELKQAPQSEGEEFADTLRILAMNEETTEQSVTLGEIFGLRQTPQNEGNEQSNPFLGALETSLVMSEWIAPFTSSETIMNERGQSTTSERTVDTNEASGNVESAGDSSDVWSEDSAEGDQRTAGSIQSDAVVQCELSSEENLNGVNFDDEDPLGGILSNRPHKSRGLLQNLPPTPPEEVLSSNSLDDFLSNEDTAISKQISDTLDTNSLEQEHEAHVFPSAFPTSSQEISAQKEQESGKTEPSSNSFTPPPSPTNGEVYVSLGDSLYTSEEENEHGITFTAANRENTALETRENHEAITEDTGITELSNDKLTAKTTLDAEAIYVSTDSDSAEVPPTLPTDIASSGSADLASHEASKNDKPKEDQDLLFLIGCFPDLELSYLKQLLTKCGNLDDALSIALVSMTTPEPMEKFSESAEKSFTRNDFLVKVPPMPSLSPEPKRKSPVPSPKENVRTECCDDEKIAQMLQEDLNSEVEHPIKASSNKSSPQSRPPDVNSNKSNQLPEEGSNKSSPSSQEGAGENGDDNLVLKLTESFAKQLQTLYGSVVKHLPHEGEVGPGDLKVLLSEKVARGIYQMWIETLKAKHIEYQVHAELLMKRDEELAWSLAEEEGSKQRVASEPFLSNRQTPRHHHNSCPPSRSKSVIVKPHEGNLNMSQQIQLNQLCASFPEVNRSTVSDVLLGTKFNYEEACQQLSDLFPSTTHVLSTPKSKPKKVGVASQKTAEVGVATSESTEYQDWENETSYDDLRAEAALHAKLRAENFQKAARAHGQKQWEIARYYAQQGHLHTEKMKEANRRAAGYTIKKLNSPASPGRLDLHGLHVTEALEALEEKLVMEKKDGVLYVITGRGSHSDGQVARIKPAVVSFLKRSNYKFDEVNAGMLKVKLR